MTWRKSIIKIERWRLELWKYQVNHGYKSHIIDPAQPDDEVIKAYSDGVNIGIKLSLNWFEKYVEGKK